MTEPELRTPDEWCVHYGLQVLDPDGWRGPGEPSWEEPITADEFIDRAGVSTCKMLPIIELDEATQVILTKALESPRVPRKRLK